MNLASKTLDWGDDTFGYQQEHGARDLSSTHNIVRFHPAPDGGLEIAFGTTAYFCGGTVVHRADGSVVLDGQQRNELAAKLGASFAALGDWQPPVLLSETGADRLANIRKLLEAHPEDPDAICADELRALVRILRRELGDA